MNSLFNSSLCMSIRSKGCSLQCQHPKKNGSDYCGIHTKAKNIIRIDTITQVVNFIEPVKKIKKIEVNQVKDDFPDWTEKYAKNEKSIILIQKSFRRWNIFRRHKSNNKEECGTLDSIFTIPIEYYFDYKDTDGFIYSFDIRTLDLISLNPYNQKAFPNESRFKYKLESKIQYIKKTERKMKFESPKLTEEQKYDQFLIRVFQKYDMIGQYTDTNWFNNLSFDDLKKFYKNAYDMFDYRSQLSMDIRKKITKDGLMFSNMIHEIGLLRPKHKKILQLELLKEMEKIVDEGCDKEYKTLGINLVLSALVEVSPAAALSLPHLVQSTFS